MTQCKTAIKNSATGFGTSGVRGLVDDLDDMTVFAYVLAYVEHLLASKQCQTKDVVWVGHDQRPSSARITKACIAALLHCSMEPKFCGIISTPSLAFSALSNKQAAIMITGSHIPFDRNGIKFYKPDGEMLKADERPVKNCSTPLPKELFDGQALQETSWQAKDYSDNDMANALWHSRYLYAFQGLLSGMRIGHYQHSAAGRVALSKIFMDLGAQVVQLGRSNTFVPIDTEAVSDKDKKQAQEWSETYKFDAIISTDGDGDRPLLADEKGHYFRGDTLGILAAHALGATTVVTPVSSNSALEKSKLFDKVVRTKIGSPHVIAAMQKAADTPKKDQETKIVGFEANGGFLTQSTLTAPFSKQPLTALATRDAVLPILATIALAKQKGLKLSELATLLPQRFTASDRLENTPKKSATALIKQMTADLQTTAPLTRLDTPATHKNKTDGLRLTFANDDIVHIRPSGNAPELRIYVESSSAAKANALLKHAKEKISKQIQTIEA